jgi:ribosomal protein S18 acetylase RimI-like enzyme
VPLDIRPMHEDEFVAWLRWARDDYADSMSSQGGVSSDPARAKADADFAALFPGDRPAQDQSVFVLEVEGERVGELWVAERTDNDLRGALWVFGVHIDETHRGRGYGREAMLHAEEEARRRGLDRVMLNVFGRNDVARNLYRSLGYEENAVIMTKKL